MRLWPRAFLFAVLITSGCGLFNNGGYDWSASFPGNSWQIHQVPDGGYILISEDGSTGRSKLLRTDSMFRLTWSVDGDSLGCRGLLFSVRVAADGGYLLVGGPSGGAGTWLGKTDSSGGLLWGLIMGLSSVGIGCSCPTTDGGCAMIGSAGGLVELVKVSSDGKIEWQMPGDSGVPYWVAQTPDCGYLVHGPYGRLCRFDPAGNAVWSREVNVGTGWDCGYLTPQGECVCTMQPGIAKLDTAGNVKWQTTFPGSYERIVSVQPTSDGGSILAGTTDPAHNVALVKTDSLGKVEWCREFGGDAYESGTWAEQTADGGYVVAGVEVSYGLIGFARRTIRLKKTDASGN